MRNGMVLGCFVIGFILKETSIVLNHFKLQIKCEGVNVYEVYKKNSFSNYFTAACCNIIECRSYQKFKAKPIPLFWLPKLRDTS